ncbi:hypothetical protein NG895_15985 [Aeoliella sp. ICT_H6.2]|uniref:Uncharacterized protein n=1 Tax=Aeoliella straminimaris TaxID=2954799 RepID=A0A9X2FAJ0_9BACT|nr:hypothetical protein [Aeoliella straminimaris]
MFPVALITAVIATSIGVAMLKLPFGQPLKLTKREVVYAVAVAVLLTLVITFYVPEVH